MSVHIKLMKARLELQSQSLTKSGKNTYAGYAYFELGDFIPKTQEIFAKLGLCGVVSYGADYAKLTITDTEDNSEIIITSPMSEAPLKGCLPVQCLGAVETYIRRYLWVTAMEIVEHDIVDATTGKVPVRLPLTKLPELSATNFAKAKSKYYSQVNSGEKSADDLISFLSAKYVLTDEQKIEITKWGKVEAINKSTGEIIDDPFVRELEATE